MPLDGRHNLGMDYVLAGLKKEIDMVASAKITKEPHSPYSDFFSGTGCFTGTFSLQVKDANHTRNHLGI